MLTGGWREKRQISDYEHSLYLPAWRHRQQHTQWFDASLSTNCDRGIQWRRTGLTQLLVRCRINNTATCFGLNQLNWFHGAGSFLSSWQFLSQSRNSPHFMEPDGSLQHSQQPATCPYTAPYRSSPLPPTDCFKIRINIILPSTLMSSKWPLFLTSPHQTPACMSPPLHTCHMPCPAPSWFDHPNNI
jgi:hypothetical protein